MKLLIKENLRRKKIGCDHGDLSPHQRVACDIMEQARRPLTTNEIAEFGNMSWATANKHLKILEKKRIGVKHKKIGKKTEWFIK